MITDSSVISITDKAVHCDLEDEVVILGLEDGIYYGLNPVGAFIWNFIQDPHTLTEIRNAVLEEYEVEKDVCENDLQELMADLEEKGLIEIKRE
jgi:hypothetical protein